MICEAVSAETHAAASTTPIVTRPAKDERAISHLLARRRSRAAVPITCTRDRSPRRELGGGPFHVGSLAHPCVTRLEIVGAFATDRLHESSLLSHRLAPLARRASGCQAVASPTTRPSRSLTVRSA